ncbi:uncharacterized protein [Montipora capricornis]|uniref:uncharacterized protein n=1 Tax=Montipora capricornis TaxID=246305 RepID=UPI0035F1AB71
MELPFKLFFTIVVVFFLLVEVSQARRYRRYRNRRGYQFRYRIPSTPGKKPLTTPTFRPTAQTTAIPQNKCKVIVGEIPKGRIKGPICLRLSETQLLKKLKKISSFNPRYMAINSREALKFVDLTLDQIAFPINISNFIPQNIILGGAQTGRRQQNQRETGDETGVRQKRSPGPVSTMRSCRNEGSSIARNRLRLCTECSACTELPFGAFPPFINEAICGTDRICLGGIGDCQPIIIKFTFLRSTGTFGEDDDFDDDYGDDIFIEQMETYEQDIRVGCQCQGFSSFFQQ